MDKREQLENRLRLLRSDLADSNNPEVLKRWPNLGSDELRRQLEIRIDEVIHMLAGL